MSNEAPHLRVVEPRETPRRRRPGPAVTLILVYALLFGGSLWYFRSRSPWFQKSQRGPATSKTVAGARSPRRDGEVPYTHDELLSGTMLPEPSRARYFERLAVERCNCDCARTLSDCLANEPSCTRSPKLANRIRKTVDRRQPANVR